MDFDYIVVGGGSAGCAVAARLSEDPTTSVCLLEAGKRDDSLFISMPFGVIAILPTRMHNWAFRTEPQAGLNGRRGYQPRGKVLGGSSSINAMIYMRGHPRDYDDWVALGNPGWGWSDMLPLFKRNENNERGADAFHGTGGPLNVADLRSPHAAAAAFVEAGAEAGYRRNPDFNGAEQEGVGMYQVTQKEGRRWNAARAYLSGTEARANLTVLTEAHALKLLVEGKTCRGVAASVRGSRRDFRARRETIVAGGAFGSPQLLLLSGIGPADELARHGIPLAHELPGVGRNLQDHIDYTVAYESDNTELIGMTPAGLARMLGAIGPYRREGRGLFTTNFAEAGAFLKTDAALERPDIQLHFVIGIVEDHARKQHFRHGFSCHVCVLRPKSAGSLGLQSTDPFAPPRIDPGFLTHDDDLATLVKGVKATLDITGRPALERYRGRNLFGDAGLGDTQLAELLRNRADTVYHPVGTCRMGIDAMAVVDPRLRVRGIEQLRVADASIMPRLIGGNTNVPSMVIGEKAAALIRADAAR